METREILVKNTRDQKTYKIMTAATTLGELKEALDAEGVDYVGMTFTEGISNTSLIDDSSQLPINVKYKGQTTNNLVFLLTNTKKDISSGISVEREQAYEAVRKYGLQDEIKDAFGRNFTLVSTADIWAYINDNVEGDEPEEEENEEEDTYALDDSHGDLEGDVNPMDFITNLYDLLKALVKSKAVGYPEVKTMAELTNELAGRLGEFQAKYSVGNVEISQSDLDEMLAKL